MMKLARNALADVWVIESPEGLGKWAFIVKLHQLQQQLQARFANR